MNFKMYVYTFLIKIHLISINMTFIRKYSQFFFDGENGFIKLMIFYNFAKI